MGVMHDFCVLFSFETHSRIEQKKERERRWCRIDVNAKGKRGCIEAETPTPIIY